MERIMNPLGTPRKVIEAEIANMQRRITYLQKELERREPADREGWGIPVNWRADDGGLQTIYVLFDTAAEAYDNAGKYIPSLVRNGDDIEARYKVQKIYR